jgi:DNA-binding transcriptional regulator/RsmH inhibitor MraZ
MKDILFFGTYTHKVDSKGRVSIPAEWRKHLDIGIHEKKGIIATWEYNILFCYKDMLKISFKDYQFLTHYNLDTEGRITLKNIRNKLAILKGCGDYFTIEFRD